MTWGNAELRVGAAPVRDVDWVVAIDLVGHSLADDLRRMRERTDERRGLSQPARPTNRQLRAWLGMPPALHPLWVRALAARKRP